MGFETPVAVTKLNPASVSGGMRLELENDATPPLPVMVSTSAPSAMVRIRAARLGAAEPATNATAATPANNKFLICFSSISNSLLEVAVDMTHLPSNFAGSQQNI